MHTLGIIPARQGSKRITNKNTAILAGKPLIQIAIETALDSPLTKVIVSTDSESIARDANRYGAEVPFLRPSSLSGDGADDASYVRHAISELEKQNEHYCHIAILRPTQPFRTSEDIADALKKIETGKHDLVRSVTLAEGTHHPFWMYTANNADTLTPLIVNATVEQYPRSQTLPRNIYRLNGVIDALTYPQAMLSNNIYYSKRMGFLEIPQLRAVDIDTPSDLQLAQAISSIKGYY